MRSHYIKFEELFVQPQYRAFGVSCDRSFLEKIKRFIRPHEYGETRVNHNWIDWYVCQDFSYVRIYGFEGTPYILPKLVPDRIAYLEIVRQLSVLNAKHFGGAHKQAFLLRTLHFGDFTIVSIKAYEVIDRKLIEDYNLQEHTSRKNYDSKGYIHQGRKKKNLGDYLHEHIEALDIFRNKESEEAM